MDLTSITPGPEALRALSHPVRLKILGLLRVEGPSTASALAARLGLNSGATSYHLRQLAQHGFVVDDTERGNARDRWWKAAHQATRTADDRREDPEAREAADAFSQAVAIVHTDQLQQAVEERPLLPAEWRPASMLSDWGFRLTPGRARQLREALVALLDQWGDEPDAEGAEDFVVTIHSYPHPGRVGTEEKS
ncbi:MAG: ArsR/SmtB family transcription factor [Nocardioidaceae bacterium]